jgi:hypothetical protein
VRSKGRKLLTTEHPIGPRAKFAWLVRAVRVTHPDRSLQNTSEFSARLSACAGVNLAPDTINKYETGQLEFTLERCIQFEDALSLNRGDLVDPYCYLYRIYDQVPKIKKLSTSYITPQEIETIYKIGSGETIGGVEWLQIAMLYRRKPELLERVKDYVAERFFDDLANRYEREERLLLEAAIHLRPLLAPHMRTALTSDPSRLFNLVESLGHEPDAESVNIIESIAEELIDDEFLAQSILEAVSRINRLQQNRPFASAVADVLNDYSRYALTSDEIFYCAQEESLGYLESVRTLDRSNVIEHVRSGNVDLRQLVPHPIGFTAADLRREAQLEMERYLLENLDSPDAGLPLLPGVSTLLTDALVGGDRRSRLSISIMLRSWNGASAATEALGGLLARSLPEMSFGVRRAAIRALTKIGADERVKYILNLTSERVKDGGCACMLGWSLGSITGDAAQVALINLYDPRTSNSTKRALLVSGRRQRNSRLLERMTLDTDPNIAQEASIFLDSIRHSASGGLHDH